MKRLSLVFVFMSAAGSASAATYCVESGDVAALSAAITAAQTNGEDDLIRMEIGQYDLSSDLIHDSGEPHALTIEGGYLSGAAPCAWDPTTPDASTTRIDGGNIIRVALNPLGGDLTIKGLTISRMFSGIGQFLPSVSLAGKNITISNVVLSENVAPQYAGIGIYGNGAIQLQNSLFSSNASWNGGAAIEVQNGNVGGLLCNWIINSTIAGNSSSLAGLSLQNNDPTCPSIVANSVFWDNGDKGTGEHDLKVSSETFLISDDVTVIDVDIGPLHPDSASFSMDPLFKDSSSGDYRVRDDSPLRDRGTSDGGFIWSPGDWDVVGKPRFDNGLADIGAFEVQDVIYAHGFDWQL